MAHYAAIEEPASQHLTSQIATAARIALVVSQRLLITEDLSAHWAATGSDSRRQTLWNAGGVAAGDAGLAVLAACLDNCYVDDGWDEAGERRLSRAFTNVAARDVSLFSGLTGLAYATHLLCKSGERRNNLTGQLEAILLSRIAEQVEAVRSFDERYAVSTFDLISGLVGQCVYLLSCESDASDAVCREALSALAWLCGPGADEFRWACTPLGAPSMSNTVVMNLGLAHGMPGILAILSIAELAGRGTPGGPEVVERNAEWLVRNLSLDEHGPNLPAMRARDQPTAPVYPRAAWCYGAAGVGRALTLCGEAVGSHRLRDIGLELIRASYRRLKPVLAESGLGFCHGVGGILYLLAVSAAEFPNSDLEEAKSTLLDHVVAAYQDYLPFGFTFPMCDSQDRDPHHPGLLTGAAGVALSLLKATTPRSLPSDRLFLTA